MDGGGSWPYKDGHYLMHVNIRRSCNHNLIQLHGCFPLYIFDMGLHYLENKQNLKLVQIVIANMNSTIVNNAGIFNDNAPMNSIFNFQASVKKFCYITKSISSFHEWICISVFLVCSTFSQDMCFLIGIESSSMHLLREILSYLSPLCTLNTNSNQRPFKLVIHFINTLLCICS